MAMLTRTRDLIANISDALGVPPLTRGNNGEYSLTAGENTEVMIFGGGDETILIVAPLAELPRPADRAVTTYLLRHNMFDSALLPFHVALDEDGGLILWARLRIDDLSGESLASLVHALGCKIAEMRWALADEETESETAPAET
jgi:hypothetical protein